MSEVEKESKLESIQIVESSGSSIVSPEEIKAEFRNESNV